MRNSYSNWENWVGHDNKPVKLIIFDVDGTLSLVGDRLQYLEEKDWDSFYDNCGQDSPNIPVIRICQHFMRETGYNYEHVVLFLTGRPERVRAKTLGWLSKYGIHTPSEFLLMRSDNDHRKDTEFKFDKIKHLMSRIFVVFEDRQSVVDMWRSHGVTCLQVSDGNY